MKKREKKLVLVFMVFFFSTSIIPTCVKADSSNNDWLMFRGDAARTGYLANTGSSVTGWNYSIYSPVISSPAVSNGLVFIKGDHLICLNSSTGTKVWESSINSAQQFSSPVVSDGYVYACNDLQGTIGGEVYALNETNGEQIWSFPAYSSSSTPAVANGVVYIGSENGNIYAVDAYSGQKLWNYSTGGAVNSSPAIDEGVVFVSANDGNLYALNATTGSKIWNCTTGNAVKYTLISSPAVAHGVVYIGSNSNGVYALNATTGDKIWNFKSTDSIISTPAVSDKSVFVVASSFIYAIDASKGVEIWKYPITPEYAPNGNEPSSPAVAEGIVYVNSFDFNLYAFNATTGEKVGNFTLVQPDIDFLARFSSPAVTESMVYVGIDETLYGINISFFSLPKSSNFYFLKIIAVAVVIAIVVVSLLLYLRHRRI